MLVGLVLAACGGDTDEEPGASPDPCETSFEGCRGQAEELVGDDELLWPVGLPWEFVDASYERTDSGPVITVTTKPPEVDPISLVIVKRSSATTAGEARQTAAGRAFTLSKREDGSLALALYAEGQWEYQVMNSFGNPRQVVPDAVVEQLVDSLSAEDG